MAAPRLIGDILCDRRRSLGLSVDRVVEDTKLQRRMIEAFEDSDFDAMPPKGYAQASLSSYARYLGLDPNEILRVYDDQLYEYQRETQEQSRRSGRGRAAVRSGDDERQGRMRPPYDRDDHRRQPDQVEKPRYQARGSHEEDVRVGGDRRFDGYDGERSYGRDPYGSPRPSRGSGVSHDGRARYDESPARQRGLYDEPAGRPSSRSIRDRGLYDSGYRSDRRSQRDDDRMGSYADEPAAVVDRDRRSRASSRASERTERVRGATQVVSLDDGYQGGSGGLDGASDRYQPRPPVPQRQSLSEVAWGVWDSLRSDTRTFALIVVVVVATLGVIVAVGISSCTRSSGGDAGEDNTIPVTPVSTQQTLAQSVDLSSVPAGTIVSLTKDAQSDVQTWVEAWIDGVPTYADIPEPGTSLQWTIEGSATLKLSNVDGITVVVNGTQANPILENGTYVLNIAVAASADDGAVA